MPMAMISFSENDREENLIELFKRKLPEIDIYELIGQKNSKTDSQDLTYVEIIEQYLVQYLSDKVLFN